MDICETLICAEFVLEKWRLEEKFREFVNPRGNYYMYIQLLTQLKNAQNVGQERVKIPHSIFNERVLDVLASSGYIGSVEKKGKNPKKYLEVVLHYANGKGAINGFRLMSTPSHRVYKKATELRPVKQGYGILVVSTSKGVMKGSDARTQKLGGQVLFTMW